MFVVGLSPRLADPEVLKKHEYFGKFGKIHKVVINQSTSYAGSQVRACVCVFLTKIVLSVSVIFMYCFSIYKLPYLFKFNAASTLMCTPFF